jgi:hypothetical protein
MFLAPSRIEMFSGMPAGIPFVPRAHDRCQYFATQSGNYWMWGSKN